MRRLTLLQSALAMRVALHSLHSLHSLLARSAGSRTALFCPLSVSPPFSPSFSFPSYAAAYLNGCRHLAMWQPTSWVCGLFALAYFSPGERERKRKKKTLERWLREEKSVAAVAERIGSRPGYLLTADCRSRRRRCR